MDVGEQSTVHEQTQLIYDSGSVSVLLPGFQRLGRKHSSPSDTGLENGIIESNCLWDEV